MISFFLALGACVAASGIYGVCWPRAYHERFKAFLYMWPRPADEQAAIRRIRIGNAWLIAILVVQVVVFLAYHAERKTIAPTHQESPSR